MVGRGAGRVSWERLEDQWVWFLELVGCIIKVDGGNHGVLGWGTSSRQNGQEAQEAGARLAPAGAFVDEHDRVEFVQASDKECAEGPWQCDLPLD